MSRTSRQRLGAAGEAHARRHLEARGYRFCMANWHGDGGELDLIMHDDEDELVFVEVKIRSGEGLGRAEEAVTPRQQRKLLATAEAFIQAHPEYDETIWRFDLMAITLDAGGAVRRVTHVENCLG